MRAAELMEANELGKTGPNVSRLGFGGAPVGLTDYLSEYSPADTATCKRVIAAIHRAVELDITYFDTAGVTGLIPIAPTIDLMFMNCHFFLIPE